jgi:hypothetical protein
MDNLDKGFANLVSAYPRPRISTSLTAPSRLSWPTVTLAVCKLLHVSRLGNASTLEHRNKVHGVYGVSALGMWLVRENVPLGREIS